MGPKEGIGQMPEYLSPGVYVEEIELGPRPIEGVSTSTAGFVGVARRGPVNYPRLVTSIGEYFRFFGNLLGESYGDNRWLPYAVDGFFTNGGQRLYVVRVANLPPDGDTNPDPKQFALTAAAAIASRADASRRSLTRPVEPGASTLAPAFMTGLSIGSVVQVGEGADAEFVSVTGFRDKEDEVTVTPPVRGQHGASITVMQVSGKLTELARIPANTADANDVRVSDRSQLRANEWVKIADGDRTEYLHLGAIAGPGPGDAPVTPGLLHSHEAGTAATAAAAAVAATTTLGQAAGAGGATIELAATAGLSPDDWVVVAGNAATEDEAVCLGPLPAAAPFTVPVSPALRFDHNNANGVLKLTDGGTSTDLVAGIRLKADGGLIAGADVLIEDGASTEFVRLQGAPTAPDFDVTLARSLRFAHPADAGVRHVDPPTQTTATTAATELGSRELTVTTAGLAADDVVELVSGAQTEYARITALDAAGTTVTVSRPLRYPHPNGTPVRRLAGTIGVTAGPARPDPTFFPEPGSWGNDIRVRVENATILATELAAAAGQGEPSLQLVTANGIELGTLLRLPGNRYASVSRVEGNRVYLDGGVPAGGLQSGQPLSTLEFKLTVSWFGLEETYDKLSLDPRHSRHFARQVNATSLIVHVEGLGGGAPTADDLPLPGDWYPGGGSDGADGIGAATFAGKDNADADRRSGLFALLNVPGVSIVAVPGQHDPVVQRALIDHCESARYRFAILDGADAEPLDGIQVRRSLYDSKYAALYYPWVQVFDTLANRPVYTPPSGLVAGLYARTDAEVGVHRAPANAVLRQVSGPQFTITKGQQDILNPIGINAIRAFPGRGIRVWGARTISSDSLWRYVNVRRLFNFVERSIDEGTQYAVFMPNDLPLWNQLKGSVTAFLRTVWRSGALQGVKEEEAFFIKCGLGETMIQADIDAGRVLILIGIAPVKPAEFVVFRIGQKPGGSDVSE
jgi:phage tail sheath protein FI